MSKTYRYQPIWNARRSPPYTVGLLAPDTKATTKHTFTIGNNAQFGLAKMDIYCITRNTPVEVDCSVIGDSGKQVPGTFGFQMSRVGVDVYRIAADTHPHLLKLWREP